MEIYADWPRESWRWQNDLVQMQTRRLDVPTLLAKADERPWQGGAADTRIGHVHLQVGDTAQAEQFYGEQIGLDLTCRYPGARFFSRDGYHHHIATNTWNSAGAAPRPANMAGLQRIELGLEPGQAPAREIADPWGVLYQMAPRPQSAARPA